MTPQDFDLFGDPIPANWARRGRPEHVRTNENINKVMLLVALGWSNARMANALNVSDPTFKKHYFSLVESLRERNARDALDAAYAMKLWKQVEAGNVGAMRLWQDFLERNDLMTFGQTKPAEKKDGEAKPEKLGKKEAALAAAKEPDRETRLGALMARRQGLN